jgi:hypothetical protein
MSNGQQLETIHGQDVGVTILGRADHVFINDGEMTTADVGAFSSSSRQASVSDLLPSPTAFATRARRQPSSRRRRFAAAVASPPAPPCLGTPGRPVVGPDRPVV